MTTKQIQSKQAAEAKKVAVKHETAARIRELLDEARKEYGADAWDEDSVEADVLELVTEE